MHEEQEDTKTVYYVYLARKRSAWKLDYLSDAEKTVIFIRPEKKYSVSARVYSSTERMASSALQIWTVKNVSGTDVLFKTKTKRHLWILKDLPFKMKPPTDCRGAQKKNLCTWKFCYAKVLGLHVIFSVKIWHNKYVMVCMTILAASMPGRTWKIVGNEWEITWSFFGGKCEEGLKTMICVNYCLNTTRYRGCKSWKYNIGRNENVKILCQIAWKIV